jgi:hypothetical protein
MIYHDIFLIKQTSYGMYVQNQEKTLNFLKAYIGFDDVIDKGPCKSTTSATMCQCTIYQAR